MLLLTKELEQRFEKVGSQEEVKDPIIIAKFFNPTGAGTWYATEYIKEEKKFFGYVQLGMGAGYDEWVYFSLDELQNQKVLMGLGIERDLHFGERKISTIINKE